MTPPDAHLRTLRQLWRERSNDVAATLTALCEFAAANPIAAPVAPDGDTVAEEELQLACWMAAM